MLNSKSDNNLLVLFQYINDKSLQETHTLRVDHKGRLYTLKKSQELSSTDGIIKKLFKSIRLWWRDGSSSVNREKLKGTIKTTLLDSASFGRKNITELPQEKASDLFQKIQFIRESTLPHPQLALLQEINEDQDITIETNLFLTNYLALKNFTDISNTDSMNGSFDDENSDGLSDELEEPLTQIPTQKKMPKSPSYQFDNLIETENDKKEFEKLFEHFLNKKE